MLEQLIVFLRSEFKISAEAISLARKTQNLEPNILPIVLSLAIWTAQYQTIKPSTGLVENI